MARNPNPPTISPLLLRLTLGVTFLWAGVGKLMTQEYGGAAAGAIASMGEGNITQGQWPPAPPTVADVGDDEAEPATENGATHSSAEPAAGEPTPEANPDTLDEAADEAGEILDEVGDDIKEAVDATTDDETDAAAITPPADPLLRVEARRVYGLAAMLKMSADGNDQRARLIPKSMGTDAWVKVLAWAAVCTELAAGAAMIVGLFTRLAAFGLVGNMCVAMWLTQIGPVVRARTDTGFLGFLPDPMMDSPMWTSAGWNTMLWQLALIAMSAAILFMGPGRASLDAWVFGSGRREKPSRSSRSAAPASRAEPASRPRRPDYPGESSGN